HVAWARGVRQLPEYRSNGEGSLGGVWVRLSAGQDDVEDIPAQVRSGSVAAQEPSSPEVCCPDRASLRQSAASLVSLGKTPQSVIALRGPGPACPPAAADHGGPRPVPRPGSCPRCALRRPYPGRLPPSAQ